MQHNIDLFFIILLSLPKLLILILAELVSKLMVCRWCECSDDV